MNRSRAAVRILCLVLLAAAALFSKPGAAADRPAPQGKLAPKPLFRDPVHDGAADPVVVWNRRERKWFMLYTNRRANDAAAAGVTWVHGTRIGVAESADGGATWKYKGTAEIGYGPADYTHWAPDVVHHAGTYHMFLTVVPGVFKDWNATRDIVHLTSSDLLPDARPPAPARRPEMKMGVAATGETMSADAFTRSGGDTVVGRPPRAGSGGGRRGERNAARTSRTL
ncbi:MAG TPA: hypothetical protein VK422_14910 [Pyrinomonadaceae bacterium]|nr:hypothetical protein [Pyrinomonadaceae bacterium]